MREIIKPMRWVDTGKDGDWRYQVVEAGIYQTRVFGAQALIKNKRGYPLARLRVHGVLHIYPDYTWNGPNVVPDTRTFMQGSGVHDCLWQMIEEGLISPECRAASDYTMKEINIKAGMWRWYAWLTWFMVKTFGRPEMRNA